MPACRQKGSSKHANNATCQLAKLPHPRTTGVHAAVVQVETGSAITWKYPSVVLKGDNSVGEFYSVALTNNRQQVRRGRGAL